MAPLRSVTSALPATLDAAIRGDALRNPPAGYSGLVSVSIVVQSAGHSPVAADLTLGYGPYLVTTTADSGPGSFRRRSWMRTARRRTRSPSRSPVAACERSPR